MIPLKPQTPSFFTLNYFYPFLVVPVLGKKAMGVCAGLMGEIHHLIYQSRMKLKGYAALLITSKALDASRRSR
jgi:hypothetical protein